MRKNNNLKLDTSGNMAILLEIPITTSQSLVYALDMVKEYFDGYGDPQPPIPNDISSFIPSNLLITTQDLEFGKENCRIQFIGPNDKILFDEKWIIKLRL